MAIIVQEASLHLQQPEDLFTLGDGEIQVGQDRLSIHPRPARMTPGSQCCDTLQCEHMPSYMNNACKFWSIKPRHQLYHPELYLILNHTSGPCTTFSYPTTIDSHSSASGLGLRNFMTTLFSFKVEAGMT